MTEQRAIYCGNYEYEFPESEIYKLFYDYGDVSRIDMKTGGFCFVYMEDEKDGDRAIRKLNGKEVGYKRRPLRVQWSKTKDSDRKRDTAPSKTLFVVNFDVGRTRERDLERHFDKYGPLKRVEIKKSFAFVEFENLDDAEYALKKTNLSDFNGRTITVEFTQSEGRGGRRGSPPPRRARSLTPPRRGGRSVSRSRSPISKSPRSRSRSLTPPRRRSPSF